MTAAEACKYTCAQVVLHVSSEQRAEALRADGRAASGRNTDVGIGKLAAHVDGVDDKMDMLDFCSLRLPFVSCS